jgi:RHS repeat-associated protein
LSTDKQYTGHQKEDAAYFMKARFFDPDAGRFLQPDSIVPDFADPQSLNRYSEPALERSEGC